MAELYPMPVRGDVVPMSAARVSLANAIRTLADELEELERTQRPAERLARVGQDLETVSAQLAELRDRRRGLRAMAGLGPMRTR